ncbi:hypothetical protein L6Q21_09880 [Sandaracinobacter sp. RS1-74]|uniref:hypothetical protein n=1 Tax=Sandaracinobacteroides sayramensis TaxID=2913411 RepID=UPI001EDB0AD3|nr:hypothetical protein [Sandaracinobacteroides sayramensis]MCG2841289.1 hypothetical protein [Sandaracinobacteroides sayramensis]
MSIAATLQSAPPGHCTTETATLPANSMSEDLSGTTDRPLFAVDFHHDLRPLAGRAQEQCRPQLETLLHTLLEAARCPIIAPPSEAPDDPSITDAFAALKDAAGRFDIVPGLSLADHLWLFGGDHRRGTVTERLLMTMARCLDNVQGFLLFYATDVRTPLAYAPHNPPFRVAEAIDTPPAVDGPYLVLVVCRIDGQQKAQALRGYAQPILSARQFVPVFSDLERDVLRALIGLQEALDRQGVDCAIERALPTTGAAPGHDIRLTLRRGDAVLRELHIAIEPSGTPERLEPRNDDSSYVVTPARWRDGGLVAWLERAILQ